MVMKSSLLKVIKAANQRQAARRRPGAIEVKTLVLTTEFVLISMVDGSS